MTTTVGSFNITINNYNLLTGWAQQCSIIVIDKAGQMSFDTREIAALRPILE